MFTVFTGLSGLVGCSNSFTLPVFLFGCNFSLLFVKWADPSLPILYRKVMFIVYLIAIVIFLLLFINYKREEQYNFYSSALFVYLTLSRDFYSPPPWASNKTAPISPSSESCFHRRRLSWSNSSASPFWCRWSSTTRPSFDLNPYFS